MTGMTFRLGAKLALAASLAVLAPGGAAQAQVFWQPPNLSGPAITPSEATFPLALPGATDAEYRAGLVWNLRAALNVAALQCDFEPTLLTTSNYNAMIAHHRDELAKAYVALGNYFKRTGGGTGGIDQYNTRIYASYSTVQAQRNFCQVAGSLGRDAIFADRGGLTGVAVARMGELRKALSPGTEQVFGNPTSGFKADIPSLSEDCWDKDRLKLRCKATWDAASAAAGKAGG